MNAMIDDTTQEIEEILGLDGDDVTVTVAPDENAKDLLAGDFEDPLDAKEDADEPEPEEDAYAALEAQFKRVEAEQRQTAAALADERRRVAELQNTQDSAQIKELQNHKIIIEHAYAATSAELEDAKRAYRDARNIGDVDAELAASEALSDARDKLRQLGLGHQEVTQRLENPQPVRREQPASPVGDPVEHIITTNFPNPKDQAWLRAHRDDIFGNEQRKQLVIAVEQTAKLKGFQPGTDAYYSYLDQEMGYETTPKQTPAQRPSKPAAAPTVQRKAPIPGAPVSRTGGGPGHGAERASASVKKLAEDLGITVSEYMANAGAIRDGKTHHRYS